MENTPITEQERREIYEFLKAESERIKHTDPDMSAQMLEAVLEYEKRNAIIRD